MEASRSGETETLTGCTDTPCKEVNRKEVGHLLSADWADLELPQDPQYGHKSWIAEVNVRMPGVHQSDIEPLQKRLARGFQVQRNLLATTTEVSV